MYINVDRAASCFSGAWRSSAASTNDHSPTTKPTVKPRPARLRPERLSESAGPEPVALPCRSTIATVASTDNHLYAVTSSGAVLEWRDVDSSLAPGGPPPSEPKPMGGALARTRAVSVAGGAAHVLVVRAHFPAYAPPHPTHPSLPLITHYTSSL